MGYSTTPPPNLARWPLLKATQWYKMIMTMSPLHACWRSTRTPPAPSHHRVLSWLRIFEEVEEVMDEDVCKIVRGETPVKWCWRWWTSWLAETMSVLQSPCQPLFILSNPLLTDPVLMTDHSGSVSNLSALLIINVKMFWLDKSNVNLLEWFPLS